uniref:Uncharacterized protein n=1 Tax=Siphoviridae sp. ctCNm48 TaxID=2825377 RepID=A0A8S5TW89_9CAUD|nr:MAG TPA: hypothetical protein [Siphoviridae sp. ctCNm48]
MVHCTRWASGLVWGAYPHCLTGGGCAPLLYGYHYIRLYVIVNSKIMILRNLQRRGHARHDRGGGYQGRERGRVSPKMPTKNKRKKQKGGLTFTFTV